MTRIAALELPPAITQLIGLPDAGPSVGWDFAETALGPFGTVFGGIVAGVMVDQARSLAPTHGLIASATIDFLRPTGLGRAVAAAEAIQCGRRTTLVEVSLHQGGKLTARGRVLLAASLAIEGLPRAAWADLSPADPGRLPAPPRLRPNTSRAWSGDVLDSKIDAGGGIHWMTRLDERLLPLSPAAFAVAMADYAAGFSRPDSWEKPSVKAFPNPNLSVSLVREPRGAWIGLRPRSIWDATGLGASHADLLDRDGVVGVAAATSLLLPFEAEDARA